MADRDSVLTSHHGFGTTTPVDQRPWLWTFGILSLIYSALALCARITSKWGLLWYDDAILASSYGFALVHYGLLYRSVYDGLGAVAVHLTSNSLYNAARYYFVSRFFLIIALCLAKVSMISFTRRIFSGQMYGERYIFGVSFAITAVWGITAVLASSIGCHPPQSLIATENAVCSADMARWKAITAFDVFTEVLLLALPAWLVSRIGVKASSKWVVVFVFSFRLIVAAFSLATMFIYFKFLQSGTARDSIGLVPTVISTEAMLCASLITASIPSLRSFLWAFMSRGVFTMYGVDTTASRGGSHGESIPMHSMGQSETDGDNHDVRLRNRVELRPECLGYRVDVRAASMAKKTKHAGDERSVNSDGSERMIIRRQVEFDMHED